MKLGRSAAISPMRREFTPSASAPAALPRAMSSLRNEVPSWRWKAMTWPPASTTTQDSGFMPASLPLAKVALMMVLALSRLMRKSLMGGSLFLVGYTDWLKKLVGKSGLPCYLSPHGRHQGAQDADCRGRWRGGRAGTGHPAGCPFRARAFRHHT